MDLEMITADELDGAEDIDVDVDVEHDEEDNADEVEYENFINQCLEFIPESYDMDDGGEQIILRYLEDMSKLGSILAKLTSDYR